MANYISNRSADKLFLAFSVSLYISSLTQDAFYIDRSDYATWASPIWLVLMGWLGTLMGGGAAIAWLANPLIIISWGLLDFSRRIAMLISIIASAVAGSFLLFDKVITSEAPTYSVITHHCAGYWLWLSSCALFAGYLLLSSKVCYNTNAPSSESERYMLP